MTRVRGLAPGVLVAVATAGVAWMVASVLPGVPWLTAAFVLGVVLGSIPAVRRVLDGMLRAGVGFSARTLLRAGIVLLGIDLVLSDVAALGWAGVLAIVALVVVSFTVTYAIGRWMRLPGDEPLLLAAGFSICGVSAIGAVSAARGARAGAAVDTATPVALVTLFGTAAIVVLPALAAAAETLGWRMSPEFFGAWVGASVHDVGQVVATAQSAGTAALAVAVVVKLTRVVMLAPMTAVISLDARRRARAAGGSGTLPPIVPLFIVGFVALVLVRTFLPVPPVVVDAAEVIRTALLAIALAAIGAQLRLERLVRTGGRAVGAAGFSWLVILALAMGAAWLIAR